MTVGDNFRRNLLAAMHERGLTAAGLSKSAGLNPRAVKDIEEGRVRSPKLETAFALAAALDMDPGELIGLGPTSGIRSDLAEFLRKYSEEDQARILAALAALPGLGE